MAKRINPIHGRSTKPAQANHKTLQLQALIQGLGRVDPDKAERVRSGEIDKYPRNIIREWHDIAAKDKVREMRRFKLLDMINNCWTFRVRPTRTSAVAIWRITGRQANPGKSPVYARS